MCELNEPSSGAAHPDRVRTSPKATWSLLLSLLLVPYPVVTLMTVLVLNPVANVFGVVLFAIPAWIGFAALRNIKSSSGAQKGAKIAFAGAFIALLGCVVEVIQLIFWGLATNGYRSF